MSAYFLDASAILKYYCIESGHSWVQTLCDSTQGHDIFISQASRVEVVAGICRKAHRQEISTTERNKLVNAFRVDCKVAYGIELVTDIIYALAGSLCHIHRLRAYDAVQLACAINVNKKVLTYQASPAIFICADKKLLEFACAEGLIADNPDNHP